MTIGKARGLEVTRRGRRYAELLRFDQDSLECVAAVYRAIGLMGSVPKGKTPLIEAIVSAEMRGQVYAVNDGKVA